MQLGQWISLIALGISLHILWQLRQILLLVFAAVVLATILNRVVRNLQKSKVKRGVAIAITVVMMLAIVAGFFAIILPRIINQFDQLGEQLPPALDQLRASYDWLESRIPGQILADDRNVGSIIQNLQSWVSRIVGNFFSIISNSVEVVLNVLLVLVSTIMLLISPIQYRRVFILAFPAFYRPRINEILDECERSLVGWIKGTLLAMAVIATLSYIGLLILGVPLPLVNALLAGLLEFIPNVGPTLSVFPPALLSLLDAPWKALAVIGLYLLIQQFESLVLVPLVMKHEVSLMPLFTVLSVVVFSFFFGFLGLFLAIPLLIVVQICLREILVKDIMNPWQENSSYRRRRAVLTTPGSESES